MPKVYFGKAKLGFILDEECLSMLNSLKEEDESYGRCLRRLIRKAHRTGVA
tara:strand:- start:342 stop:494 length:153 start_codon:yes stop_codon:yes gene_type:complete